jgi:arabinose-5-phosphate isomerase
VPVIKRWGAADRLYRQRRIALARIATVHLDIGVPAEACPLNLAPTASTTAALGGRRCAGRGAAQGARLHRGGFCPLASRRQPGQAPVAARQDVMRTGADVPTVRAATPLAEGLMEVTRKGLGMTAIVDEDDRVLGVFTDGDLRRALDRPPICAPPAWIRS